METTIFEKSPTSNGQQEKKKEGSAWKQVTLGGVSGILMGAGLLYAGQVVAQELGKEEAPEEGKPEDVAAAISYFASEKSSFTTGAVLDVNGGMFMG